jgi:hypothetical protein
MDKITADKYAPNKTFCQHCKAIQKVMGVVTPCLYNPLDPDDEPNYAFCEANIGAIHHLRNVFKEEIKQGGYHVDGNLTLNGFINGCGVTLSNKDNTGTWLFIPDDKDG